MEVKAFLMFHLRVGGRLALKRSAPVLGMMFAVYFIFKPELFHQLFSFLLSRGSLIPGFMFTLVCGVTSWSASSRICLGLTGWMRHLPVSGLSMRRLSEVAVLAAQTPVLGALIVFSIFSVLREGVSSNSFIFLLGVPLLGYSAAKASVPTQRRCLSSSLGYGACLFLGSGQWLLFSAGVLLLFLVDMISGPISYKKNGRTLRSGGSVLNSVIIWRAVKFRVFVPYIFALSALGAVQLFLMNNQPEPELGLSVVIFGGILSVVLFQAFFSNYLAVRRPAWPWVRSLPWSSRHRVILDSWHLFLLAFPVMFVLLFLNMKAFFPTAAFLPAASLWSSLAIRKGANLKTGALGQIFYFGFGSSLLVSLIPLCSVGFLLITPLLLKYTVECEKKLKVSKWLELHHLAAGDPLSWSQQ